MVCVLCLWLPSVFHLFISPPVSCALSCPSWVHLFHLCSIHIHIHSTLCSWVCIWVGIHPNMTRDKLSVYYRNLSINSADMWHWYFWTSESHAAQPPSHYCTIYEEYSHILYHMFDPIITAYTLLEQLNIKLHEAVAPRCGPSGHISGSHSLLLYKTHELLLRRTIRLQRLEWYINTASAPSMICTEARQKEMAKNSKVEQTQRHCFAKTSF